MAAVYSEMKMSSVDTDNTILVDQSEKAAKKKKQASKDLQKTRLCVYNIEGNCGFGRNCAFAHSPSEVKSVPDLAKTQLFTKFVEGKCTNANCTYAHGEAELKDAPNFKKKMCKWQTVGRCRHGSSCGFAHSSKEMRVEAPPGFEHIADRPQKVAPPPGLTKMGAEDLNDVSTCLPSSISQAESDQTEKAACPIPEEHLFRFQAARGSAPLEKQVALMSSAICALQAKLAQLEGAMLQSQVAQMQQNIQQLTEQCRVMEAGLCEKPQPEPSKSRLRAHAAPFKPTGKSDR